MLLQKKKGIQLQAPQTLQLGLPPNLIFTIPLVVGQHPRHLGPYPRRQSRGLIVVQLSALAPPKHGEALAHPAAGANLRARNDVVVHMGHDLGGGGAVVLHHVPVVHARGGGERGREHAHVVAQGARLAARRVGQLGPVGARAEQQVAPGQGHDVEEGDDEGRREHHEGRRAGEVAGDRGRRAEGVVGLVGGCDGAKGAVGGRGRRVEHDGDDGDDEGGGDGEGGDGAWGWGAPLRAAQEAGRPAVDVGGRVNDDVQWLRWQWRDEIWPRAGEGAVGVADGELGVWSLEHVEPRLLSGARLPTALAGWLSWRRRRLRGRDGHSRHVVKNTIRFSRTAGMIRLLYGVVIRNLSRHCATTPSFRPVNPPHIVVLPHSSPPCPAFPVASAIRDTLTACKR